MNLPQLRNTAGILITIVVGGSLLSCYHLYLSGELHGWGDMKDALNHASFTSSMMAIGWLFFRSPFARKLTELLITRQSETPAGVKTIDSTKLAISEPIKDEPPTPAA